MSLDRCRWPVLSAPYDEALRQAVGCVLERVPDVLGIIVSGTIIRGTPSASSDLDIYVIRRQAQRQRLQYRFNGVPAEIFINPPAQVRRYIEAEAAEGRPITAHMLATGFTVLALDPVVADLCDLGRDVLARGPQPTPQRLTAARYMAAARYEDATDIAATRPETARMLLDLAVFAMLHYRFLKAGRFVPRDKDLLIALDDLDAGLADLVRQFYARPTGDRLWELARAIAAHTIETYGFFDWESEPEATAQNG